MLFCCQLSVGFHPPARMLADHTPASSPPDLNSWRPERGLVPSHARAGGHPVFRERVFNHRWVPACAGMTEPGATAIDILPASNERHLRGHHGDRQDV
jgi:hypothetical protein